MRPRHVKTSVGKNPLLSCVYMDQMRAHWCRFDWQATVLACLLTRCSAGINIAISSAMIAITTRSSINVNPAPLESCFLTGQVIKLRCRFRTSVWLPAKRGPSPCLSGNLPLFRSEILISNGINPVKTLLLVRVAIVISKGESTIR